MSLFTMPGIQSSTYNVGYAFCRMLVRELHSPNNPLVPEKDAQGVG
jgi:hypothetical protein